MYLDNETGFYIQAVKIEWLASHLSDSFSKILPGKATTTLKIKFKYII